MSKVRATIARLMGDTLSTEVRKHYQAYKLQQGEFDRGEPEMAILDRLLEPEGIALDIGANIGVYTRLLSARVGPEGRVHAFEPIPTTYASLVHNVAGFEHRNVVTHHCAITEKNGTETMVLPSEGLQSMYRAHLADDAREGGRQFLVPAFALDKLRGGVLPDEINFVKIDVEGAEMKVLRGAARLFKDTRPTVLCEINGDCRNFGDDPKDVFEWFKRRKYRAYYLKGDTLEPCDGLREDNPGPNYIFCPDDRFS